MAPISKKVGVSAAVRVQKDKRKPPSAAKPESPAEPDLECQPCAETEATGAADAPLPAQSLPAAKRASGKSATKPKALVQRIYDTIDSELTKLEQQDGRSSQDRERASRALAQMVNSLEKAVDMQREIAKTGKGAKSKDKEALAYAEQLREEIAQRLERLTRKRAAGK